jgi:hypothetical protein
MQLIYLISKFIKIRIKWDRVSRKIYNLKSMISQLHYYRVDWYIKRKSFLNPISYYLKTILIFKFKVVFWKITLSQYKSIRLTLLKQCFIHKDFLWSFFMNKRLSFNNNKNVQNEQKHNLTSVSKIFPCMPDKIGFISKMEWHF